MKLVLTTCLRVKEPFVARCAVALLLLAALTACQNSKKSASTPAPSPTPATNAQVVHPAATPASTQPTPPAGAVEPIQVTPPASFSPGQLPQGRPVTFVVRGEAGQILRVKVNLERSDPMHSVTAKFPDRSRELPAMREGGDSSGNFIYQIPETGNYPLQFDSGGRTAGIDFSLLASDDPMITPGIKLEDISIDFAPFAQKKDLAPVFFGQWEGYLDDWWPSHWAVENKPLEFHIMQVAGYKKVFSGPHEKSDLVVMDNLEAALQPGAAVPADVRLPYPAYGDAGMNFSTRPQLVQGAGWRGLRRIGAFAQDDGCIFGPDALLGYVFEGISNDGRYFILMRAWVSNRSVGARLQKQCAAGASGGGPESDAFFKNKMPMLFDKTISAADPASFKPNLSQLDAVVQSLKLNQ